jgi:hypothetical protein
MRGAISQTGTDDGVERIWGLDSDGGTDRTEQVDRSFGLENRSSGPRGTDTVPVADVRINEVDDSPDYIEPVNRNGAVVDLRNWFLLCSSNQGSAHVKLTPFPAATVVANGAYIVIGNDAAVPAELPAGVAYANLLAVGGGNIPWISEEFDCALYDNLGRLVDLMRTTGHDDGLVHNHPRAPSHWADFAGATGRNNNGGADAVGRRSSGADTDRGGDWYPYFTRTMGLANSGASGLGGPSGLLDVRLDETGRGDGMAIVINAGAAASGGRYSFLFSLGHIQGNGRFFGLGDDALINWLMVLVTPPLSGFLDAQGSARVDLPPLSLPPGLQADCIFVLEQPPGWLAALTPIVEYDT